MNIYSGPVFDAHVHTEFFASGSLQAFRHLQSRFNVVAALTDSYMPSCDASTLKKLKIERCAVISQPDWSAELLAPALENGEYVAIKINLGFMHVYAEDSRLQALYALAKRYGVPVLFHTGDTGWRQAKLKYSHPLTLDDVITDYPEVNFMLVHSGNPWFADAAVLAAKNENVWLELSSLVEGPLGSTPKNSITRLMCDPIRWMLDYTGKPDKLIFGSGWPHVDYPCYFSSCMSAIARPYHRQVFFENAAVLFGKLNQ